MPGIMHKSPPASAEASTAAGISSQLDQSVKVTATHVPASVPMNSWPSMPMLKNPARKA